MVGGAVVGGVPQAARGVCDHEFGGVLGIHAQVHDPAAHDGGSNAAQIESSGPAVGVELVMRQRGIQAVFR